MASAIRGATHDGTVVMVGPLPNGDQSVPVSHAITRELGLVGSFRFNDEIDRVSAAIAYGSLDIDPVITHAFPRMRRWRPCPSPPTPRSRARCFSQRFDTEIRRIVCMTNAIEAVH